MNEQHYAFDAVFGHLKLYVCMKERDRWNMRKYAAHWRQMGCEGAAVAIERHFEKKYAEKL